MLLIEIGVIFTVFAGLIFKLFPPKKINSVYGYRSRFSMKAQSIWDEGQKFCAGTFIWTGMALVALGVTEYFLFRAAHTAKSVETMVEAAEIVLSVVVMYMCCETHLKKMFYEDGSRKSAAGKAGI